MSGSIYGNLFKISTWGESHGKAIGVVVDGCPAGLNLRVDNVQRYLNRRRPGQNEYTTSRNEKDDVEILSGTFNGKTTGTPISMLVRNTDQHSEDYGDIANYYRPGHADYTYDAKYGFRDYRGGGRSSGRETIGRVAAGAIASEILKELNINICTYVKSIGPIGIDYNKFDSENILKSPLFMPDLEASAKAEQLVLEMKEEEDSLGGVIECVVSGLPVGIGNPVFEKTDANISKGIMSMGAMKGIEFGSGFNATKKTGSENNDPFIADDEGNISKVSNNAGGVLGGMTDGSEIIFRAAVKPTSSISKPQKTVNNLGENIEINIKGRHDPLIAPRAVVVVEAMTALTIVDMLFVNMHSKMENVERFYGVKK
ncbi:MAG TPA: chorismate synthase [Clostridiales bacterium]|nr:chorismate synthase [Clostridiales bacterium]